MVNMESFRKIAHCWIDQAIINSLEDDLGTNGEINMKQAIEVFEEHNPGTYMSTTAFMFVWTLHRMLRSGEIEAKTWATFED